MSPDNQTLPEGDGHRGLERLVVFDTLSVGPVRVTPNRIVAPYRLTSGDEVAETELVYRYEEPVFDPEQASDSHLAGMIAAQTALNYGLFCRRLVFRGLFDGPDRRFLRAMAENTAREITVNKLMKPNRFLTGAARDLPLEKRRRYNPAQLDFPDSPVGLRWSPWATRRERYAVLSSGGKDSLLSYGLLKEAVTGVGPEKGQVHPLFVNESGRHWFTALNAYRHLRRTDPLTGRVWVNSDRLFAWMLRRMPFIRRDFADVRADYYPIRLWTVAVFLFGVLPLLRKRGIGRLIVGDEFDTSEKEVYNGITHYGGLYDQSVWFDAALSRYFLKKGWGVSQFSILRPLSELLIEKTLVERYPDLQRHQVSCHAAHSKAERIHPCGRCEKCRRIVGMLTGVGADPQGCGYTTGQIERCLADIADKGLHQEEAGVAQLRFLLDRRGAGEQTKGATAGLGPHPELLCLRFDRQRSPVETIPDDLRRPVWRRMLDHADGVVIRRGRRWVPVDLATLVDTGGAYPFEIGHPPGRDDADFVPSSAHGPEELSQMPWGQLTWPEAQTVLTKVDVALLPVGALEQHGPHLPLDTDAFDAEYLAHRVADACSLPKPLVLPLIPYGVSYHHDHFKGTVSIANDTLAQLVYEVGMSLARNGIRKLVVINGHGGNGPALNFAAQKINRDSGIFVGVDSGETSDVDIERVATTPNDVHAGEIETSTALAVRPQLVRMDKAVVSVPAFSSRYLDYSSRRGISWYASTHRISASGVMGDPTVADADKGRRIWEIMVAHLVAFVEDLKHRTLDEIHSRQL